MPGLTSAGQLAVKLNGQPLDENRATQGWLDCDVRPTLVKRGDNPLEIAVNPQYVPAADAWNVVYDGGRLPASPWGRDTHSPRTEAKLIDGALLIADRGVQPGDYLYYRYAWGAEPGEELVIEARAKVVSGSSWVIFTDGRSQARLGLWPDHIDLWGRKDIRYNLDTTRAFHLYRIVAQGADLRVYVDGQLRLDGRGAFRPAAAGGRNELAFGASNSTDVGEALWGSVRAGSRPDVLRCGAQRAVFPAQISGPRPASWGPSGRRHADRLTLPHRLSTIRLVADRGQASQNQRGVTMAWTRIGGWAGIAASLVLLLALAARAEEASSPASGAEFQAGFATADITPPIGWRRAGNYTERISTGIHDPLLAKALVLSQGARSLALVGNDLCSVPRALTDAARQRASEKTGIPAAHIIITATHTHGGPEYYGPLRDALHARAEQAHQGQDPHEPIDYQALLVQRWTDVIVRAHAARQAVRLSVVVPQQLATAFNRRYLMKDGSTGWNPGKLNANVFRPLGPTDPDLPFVLVREAASGKPRGSLTVFAMHTAIYGGAPFGACYPGHLQTQLRQQLDAPELMSIFGEGCAGDVNHIDVGSRDPAGPVDSQQVGARLAATIKQALPMARPIAAGELAVRSALLRIPVTPVSDQEYAAARKLMESLDQNHAPFLVVVDAWRKMFRHEFWQKYDGRLPEEVQAVRLDRDTAIVTLPHEIFVELGMAIKSGSPFRTTIVVSLANDLDFYIPTRRAFEEGHYEPTTCPLEPGCGELLVKAAVRLLNELESVSGARKPRDVARSSQPPRPGRSRARRRSRRERR